MKHWNPNGVFNSGSKMSYKVTEAALKTLLESVLTYQLVYLVEKLKSIYSSPSVSQRSILPFLKKPLCSGWRNGSAYDLVRK